jgi:hypothetical protein
MTKLNLSTIQQQINNGNYKIIGEYFVDNTTELSSPKPITLNMSECIINIENQKVIIYDEECKKAVEKYNSYEKNVPKKVASEFAKSILYSTIMKDNLASYDAKENKLRSITFDKIKLINVSYCRIKINK